jgi:hypothetical protein
VRATASAQGQLPYVVEGFTEVSEAVRRGHPVLLRREPATVAEGITVFEPSTRHGSDAGAASSVAFAGAPGDTVTVQSFDVRTARFVVRDATSVVGELELTPRRLAAYLADPDRAVGVALGG